MEILYKYVEITQRKNHRNQAVNTPQNETKNKETKKKLQRNNRRLKKRKIGKTIKKENNILIKVLQHHCLSALGCCLGVKNVCPGHLNSILKY
jgi:hypothetical protein